MKLAILASGQSFHATRWANALSEKKIDVIFISINKLTRRLNDEVTHFQVGNGKKYNYLLSAHRVRKILKELNPDIVHAHYASGYGMLGFLSNLFLHTPRITSLYGAEIFDFPKKSILHRKLLETVCSSSDLVFSTSSVMAKVYNNLYPKLPFPLVTPFGVDLNVFNPEHFPKINGNKNVTIGLVKKLEKKYGIDILIEALALLVNKYQITVTLKLVGGGSEEQNLIDLASKHNVSHLIEFIGWIDNTQVPLFLSTLDFVVIPSRFDSESFGVSAVESLAMCKPTIVSDVGGLPEVVEDKVSGYVIEKENPEAICLKIMQLIDNENETKIIAKQARVRVEKLFDWNNNVDAVITEYKKLKSS